MSASLDNFYNTFFSQCFLLRDGIFLAYSHAGEGQGAGKGSARQGCVSSITDKAVKGFGFTEGDTKICNI